MTNRIVALCCAALLAPSLAAAQWGSFLKDKVEQKAKETTGRAVDDASNKAYQEGKKGVSGGDQKADAGKEKAKPAQAKQEQAQQQREPDDEKVPPAKGKGAAPAQEEVAGGEVYGNKFDFVPGSKVLLFDDFAETGVGDYPARWTVKDGGGGNAAEVVSYKGQKWFKSTASESGVNQSSVHFLRYDVKGDLPKKFTIEFDADMAGPFSVLFNKQRGWGGREVNVELDEVQSANVHSPVKRFGKVVKRISISVNGTYVKVYIGGTRVLQDPDGVERPITRVGFRFDQLYGRANAGGEDPQNLEHQMMTGFRLAEGGKELADSLNASGRIVVHGIYFDTGSDVIRPESGGALRGVLQVLEGDPGLKFRIEGHTDDVGGAKTNAPLSEKRAAAVKAWLVKQGVDAGRLESKGLGDTKPMDSNGSPEGRANNRRVEFVKL